MKYTLLISIVLLIIVFFSSCEKDNDLTGDCFSDVPTVRQIKNQPAVVKSAGGSFYIIEQGSIDSKLNPCNLKEDFQIDNLQITISGDVKATLQGGPGPCCTEDFVITKISK
ncbi:hypothetical protein [Parafilimonas sp.]|uniref:hypothetical protein n=1 Tax=Parafilimonas sp. TaxID=1969739 RepID=UPI003F80D51D